MTARGRRVGLRALDPNDDIIDYEAVDGNSGCQQWRVQRTFNSSTGSTGSGLQTTGRSAIRDFSASASRWQQNDGWFGGSTVQRSATFSSSTVQPVQRTARSTLMDVSGKNSRLLDTSDVQDAVHLPSRATLLAHLDFLWHGERSQQPLPLAALDTLDDTKARTLRNTSLLQHILASRPSIGGRSVTTSLPLRQRQLARTHVRGVHSRLPVGVGNLDIAVLRSENQHPTHVTPRIAALAMDLFREQLIVLGRQLPAPHSRRGTRPSISKRERDALVHALGMALSAVGTQKIETPVSWRVHPRRPSMRRVALCDVRGLLPRVVFEVRLRACGGKRKGLSCVRGRCLGRGRRASAYRRGPCKEGSCPSVTAWDSRVCTATCRLFLVRLLCCTQRCMYDDGT